MKISKYRHECLLRSTAFQKDLRSFSQEYPPVFIRTQPGQWPSFPKSLSRLVERKKDVLRLKTPLPSGVSGDLLGAHLKRLSFRRLEPIDDPDYFDVVRGVSAQQYEKDWRSLQQRWPEVDPDSLRLASHKESGWSLTVRPLVAIGEFSGLPLGVNIVIPIYPDTTEAEKDVLWRLAMEAKHSEYDPEVTSRRTQPGTFEKRLKVYDAFRELRSHRKVARLLSLPETTVKGLYARALLDIEGVIPPGSLRKRRTAGTDPESLSREIAACPRCSSAERIEGFCQKHRPTYEAYVNRDTAYLREQPFADPKRAPKNRRSSGD